MNILAKIPRVNNEQILDNLVDDMIEEEYERYKDLWDALGPWRKALNWCTRGVLLMLVIGVVASSNFWTIFALVVFIPLLPAGLLLLLTIWIRCGKLIVDIYIRLDRI